jgi:large subunit ribosomal protein L18e
MLERAGKERKAPIWTTASKLLGAPEGRKVEVNVGRLSRLAAEGEAVFVPGKVLGTGVMGKKVTVGAFAFSSAARSSIESAGGSALSIKQFMEKFPEGSGVKLVK